MPAKRFLTFLVLFVGICLLYLPSFGLGVHAFDGTRLAAAETETGSNLSEKSALIEKSAPVNRNPRSNIEISLRADKLYLNPGDELRLTVETDRDCYLTVFYPSESGDVTVLWPNAENGWNNRVRAGAQIRIPGTGSAIRIKAKAGGAQHERILAVASSEPQAFFRDRDYVEQPGQMVKTLEVRSNELAAEIRNKANRFPTDLKWGTAELVARVVTATAGRETFVSGLSPKETTLLAVKSLKEAIIEKGYDWTPGVTSLSEASDSQLGALCGGREEPRERDVSWRQEMDEETKAILTDKAGRPAQWDWRNVNGKDWTTPIRDQVKCGACGAFASAAVVEMNWQIYAKKAFSGIHLSEAEIFFCGCGKCCGTGWYLNKAFDFLKQKGVQDESSYPYRPHDQECGAESCHPSSTTQPKTTISGWVKLPDAEAAKKWLSQVGPIGTGFRVFKDFGNYKSGVYKHTTGNDVGGHFIAIVGYDDAGQYWICKNSWGPAWGENGWFRIGYNECQMGTNSYPFYGVKFPITRK
jgi:C1A family cysteine protease